MILDRLGLWPARAIWLVAPVVIGNGLTQGLDTRASGPALAVEILLWITWFSVLVAILTSSPRSLTISRIAGPAAIGAAVLSASTSGLDAATVLAIGFASLFSALIYLPIFGDKMINGSAYGSERRMALRPTALVLLGPAQLAWLLVFGGLVVPPVLILAERYVLAAIAAVVGAGAAWAGSRVLHQLSKRWIVFVPAGFVIVDPLQVVDSVLLRRNEIKALGPAFEEPEDSERTDLSGGAIGLALEVELKAPTTVTLRQRGQMTNVETANLLFSPTLPGAMLSEARIRGVKIGEASATM